MDEWELQEAWTGSEVAQEPGCGGSGWTSAEVSVQPAFLPGPRHDGEGWQALGLCQGSRAQTHNHPCPWEAAREALVAFGVHLVAGRYSLGVTGCSL